MTTPKNFRNDNLQATPNLSAAFAALTDMPQNFFAENRQDTTPQIRVALPHFA